MYDNSEKNFFIIFSRFDLEKNSPFENICYGGISAFKKMAAKLLVNCLVIKLVTITG